MYCNAKVLFLVHDPGRFGVVNIFPGIDDYPEVDAGVTSLLFLRRTNAADH
jgi:hypothetical protein